MTTPSVKKTINMPSLAEGMLRELHRRFDSVRIFRVQDYYVITCRRRNLWGTETAWARSVARAIETMWEKS